MAQRIQLKRSSIPGKRPDGTYLQAGELALNTNTSDPGVFFETNTGAIAKVGPTSVSVDAPATEVGFGPGEGWVDTGNNTFNVYSEAAKDWITTLSPAFSGSTTLIFVGTSFPEASDDLSNDGSSRPFATLNRAVIEVARRSILQGRADDPFNDKFVIMLLPGDNTVLNDPGITSETFFAETAQFVSNQSLPLSTLRLFNPVEGGVLLPRGTSIVGFDLRKTEIRPTYKPYWAKDDDDIEARTSTIKWSGNSYVSSVTFKDKKSATSITAISGTDDEVAICTSLEPHGYRTLVIVDETITQADTVRLDYPANVARSYQTATEVVKTVPEGDYYVSPITPTTFTILKPDGSTLLRKELPGEPGTGTNPAEFFTLTYSNSTHHRLSALSYASKSELNEFYAKVQDAFKFLDFGGAVNNAEVSPGETIIVAPVPSIANNATNDTKNASAYINNVTVRSNWGMCAVTANGGAVEGFKSVLSSNLTAVLLQNDADVYQVYSGINWVSAKQAYATAYSVDLASVTNAQAMSYITSTVDLQNIRFYYTDQKNIGPAEKSNGLPDERSDTRHYTIKGEGSSVIQASSNYSVGAAIGFWSVGGSSLTLTGCTVNFGIQGLRAEGFAGIGTAGGSIEPDQGFAVTGIRRPANVTKAQLADPLNHTRTYVNQSVLSTTASTINFAEPIDTAALLPYTLRPGTAIWAEDIVSGQLLTATLATPALSEDRKTINVNSGGNTITGFPVNMLGLPFLRRFKDPRKSEDQSYSLWVTNSSSTHRSPERGNILRFAETPDVGSGGLIATGTQLDPGVTGGWNHVLGVENVVTAREGNNPNWTVDSPASVIAGNEGYYVELGLKDSYGPWVGNQTADPANYRYSQGSLATYNNRNFRADANQLDSGAAQLSPADTNSVWAPSESFEVLSLVDDTYISSDNYTAASKDPLDPLYVDTDSYIRGQGINGADYDLENYIDYDNGTATLGLEGGAGGGYANYGNPAYFDPPFNNSKQAISRFLQLLGYDLGSLYVILQPQPWTYRSLKVSDFPISITGQGYALAAGNWPVEFNVQSSINSVAMAWEYSGYLNYSKGLPQYQGSNLLLRQRFDAIASEAWGGDVTATGITEVGETVFISSSSVNESGRQLSG